MRDSISILHVNNAQAEWKTISFRKWSTRNFLKKNTLFCCNNKHENGTTRSSGVGVPSPPPPPHYHTLALSHRYAHALGLIVASRAHEHTRASTIESEWNESSHDSRVFTAAEPLCFAAGLGRRTEPVRRLFCSGFIEFCLMLAVA